jgi:hypothetical protein
MRCLASYQLVWFASNSSIRTFTRTVVVLYIQKEHVIIVVYRGGGEAVGGCAPCTKSISRHAIHCSLLFSSPCTCSLPLSLRRSTAPPTEAVALIGRNYDHLHTVQYPPQSYDLREGVSIGLII